MYRGNGRGGFVTGQREQIGSGWQGFTALFAGGDFSGDGRPDLIARDADGLLFMYRGNGRGGFVTGQREQIGSGWSSLSALTLVWDPIPPRPRPGSRRTAGRRDPGRQRADQGHQGLHPPGRPPQGPRPHPPPRRAHAAAGAVRRLLRHAAAPKRVDHRRPFVGAAADEPARGQARARAGAGLLPALGVEEAAAARRCRSGSRCASGSGLQLRIEGKPGGDGGFAGVCGSWVASSAPTRPHPAESTHRGRPTHSLTCRR